MEKYDTLFTHVSFDDDPSSWLLLTSQVSFPWHRFGEVRNFFLITSYHPFPWRRLGRVSWRKSPLSGHLTKNDKKHILGNSCWGVGFSLTSTRGRVSWRKRSTSSHSPSPVTLTREKRMWISSFLLDNFVRIALHEVNRKVFFLSLFQTRHDGVATTNILLTIVSNYFRLLLLSPHRLLSLQPHFPFSTQRGAIFTTPVLVETFNNWLVFATGSSVPKTTDRDISLNPESSTKRKIVIPIAITTDA